MDVALLIDSIVRQTTVLIAQLATARGARTPLADVAEQVFRDLADELHRQGVSRKVAADMFGMALRSYRRKLQRLEESRTVTGRSLWEAVHEYVAGAPGVTRTALLGRFHRDDEGTLKAVLSDLVESGLLYRSGRGGSAAYRVVTPEERAGVTDDSEGADTLVWGAIFRAKSADRAALARVVPLGEDELDRALARLVGSGRVTRSETGSVERYEAGRFVIPVGAEAGWEAAVFDHYQALVATVLARLRGDDARTAADDQIGGSTYTYEVWPGHPLEDEVLGELARQRRHLSELRARVIAHNRSGPLPKARTRVVIYGGQNVLPAEDSDNVT